MPRQGLAIVCGVVLLVSACTGDGRDDGRRDDSNPSDATVRKAGDDGQSTAKIPDVETGEPWSLYAGDVCSTGGTVRLTGVTLRGAKDLRIGAWGLRQFDDTSGTQAPGAQPGTLTSFRIGHDPVRAKCADNHADAVFVELVRTGSAPSGTGSVVFSYHKADGSTVTRPLNFVVKLCAGSTSCTT